MVGEARKKCYNERMGYSKHAFLGSSWNSLVKVLTIFVTAAKYFLLYRLLTPHDFGLAQYVIIAIGILESFTETGINTTIVQSKKSITYFLDTAWVISILRGLLISILMILSGFWMRNFFHEDGILLLATVASFSPLIKGFINPAVVTLYKDLRFFRNSVYLFSLVFVDAVAAITFAFLFRSVFIFVYAMIVSALFEVVISFLFFTDIPRFNFLKSRAQEIFANARGLNLSAILSYLNENIDNLLVGKVVGTTGLGIYSNGYSLSHKFTLQFAKSVQYGTFPIFVKISDEKKRLQRAFWKSSLVSLGIFAIVSIPFMLFPAFVVQIFAGDQWGAVVPILRPLVVASLIQSFVAMSTALFTATKNYTWLNGMMFINFVSLVALVVILGSQYGLQGSVWGVLLSRAIVLPFALLGIWSILTEKKTV
jgi:lipopolysaccharide exporter